MTARRVIALVLVLALLGAGVYYLRRMDQQEKNYMRDLYTEIEPLQRQRELLAQERDNLELNYALMMRDVATTQILFRELDEKLFSEVYPLMRDRGITGIIGLSGAQFPGMGKLINVAQFNRLMMDGWGSCYVYNSRASAEILEQWLKGFEDRLTLNELPIPTAIYFPGGSYMAEYDEILINHGIQTVITDAPDGRSTTVTDVTGQLWFTGAMPWNYTGVASDTDLLSRTDGANLSFTVSFSNLWDAFEQEAFIHTRDTLAELQVKEDPLNEQSAVTVGEEELQKPVLRICRYDEAREAHLTAMQNNAVYTNEFQKRQADLEQQIAALDEQIRQLYDQWQK